jgi:cytidine deaminase
MNKKVLQIAAEEYTSFDELNKEDQKLIVAARKSSENAYAPYSKFKVGAAIRLDNDEIIASNNQENADFTDGLCAERLALFHAHSKYPEVAVKALAVTAYNKDGLLKEPAKPCGSCRQVMIESEVRYKHAIRVILDGADKILIFDSAELLLPFAFKPDSLG